MRESSIFLTGGKFSAGMALNLLFIFELVVYLRWSEADMPSQGIWWGAGSFCILYEIWAEGLVMA